MPCKHADEVYGNDWCPVANTYCIPNIKCAFEREYRVMKQGNPSYKQSFYDVIAQIYAKYPTGGALHIVLDDGNTENRNIDFCIRHAVPHYPEEDQRLFVKCADLLFKVKSPRKRYKMIKDVLDKLPW